jgi:hypothetical protein
MWIIKRLPSYQFCLMQSPQAVSTARDSSPTAIDGSYRTEMTLCKTKQFVRYGLAL